MRQTTEEMYIVDQFQHFVDENLQIKIRISYFRNRHFKGCTIVESEDYAALLIQEFKKGVPHGRIVFSRNRPYDMAALESKVMGQKPEEKVEPVLESSID